MAGQFEAVQRCLQAVARTRTSRVSLFIDPDETQIARRCTRQARRSSSCTPAATPKPTTPAEQAARIPSAWPRASSSAATLGIKVNAGHGLHYTNVQQIAALDGIVELNIGHAIVAHAIFAGWENAVREMKAIMVAARLGARA